MPNKKGGKKFKRGKKGGNITKEFIQKDNKEHEEYASIQKILGSGRYELLCQDGLVRIGICRGTIKKRTRLIVGDIVLVTLWVDLQDDKCSIIHKYEDEHVHKLLVMNELTHIKNKDDGIPNDDIFDYGLVSEDEDDRPEMKMPSSSSSSEEEEIDIDDI